MMFQKITNSKLSLKISTERLLYPVGPDSGDTEQDV